MRKPFKLTRYQRRQLQRELEREMKRVKAGIRNARLMKRLAIVILADKRADKGFGSHQLIANQAEVKRLTVAHWLREFRKGGVKRLARDAPRSGRPRKISDDKLAEIKSALRDNRRLKVRRESIGAIAKRFQVKPMTVWRLNQAMNAKR